jgi:hypothetical protein
MEGVEKAEKPWMIRVPLHLKAHYFAQSSATLLTS